MWGEGDAGGGKWEDTSEVANNSSINITTTVNGKFKVAKMEDGGDQLASLCKVTLGEPDVLEDVELLKMLGVIIAHVLMGTRHPTLAKIPGCGLAGELHVLPLLC